MYKRNTQAIGYPEFSNTPANVSMSSKLQSAKNTQPPSTPKPASENTKYDSVFCIFAFTTYYLYKTIRR